jgi:hypothetical protein
MEEPLAAEEPSFDLIAAALRADQADLGPYCQALATKLEDALPEQVRVRRSGGLLSRGKRVERITVTLGKECFELIARGSGLLASRATLVRGIVLSRDELPLSQWVDALSQRLAEEARASEQARRAAERLLGIA